MARDVYQTFFNEYKIQIFGNIAQSEQHHMDMVKIMLDQQGLDDPAGNNTAGVFIDPAIQSLYDESVATGLISMVGALKVGGKIEELDIADLHDAMDDTSLQGLNGLYERLLQASQHHLRAFARTLDSLDEGPYEAQVLGWDEVQDILL